MRHISSTPESKIPRNAEFNFLARATKLVDKWHEILNTNKPANDPESEVKENGDGTEVDTGAMEVDDKAVNEAAAADTTMAEV